MTLIDIGKGPPLVLIPGIQGRWEYVRPAVDALATSFRTLTFPLCGERGSGGSTDPARGIDPYVRQIAAALEDAGIARATVCGISFGGLPAIRFASQHPERTSALIWRRCREQAGSSGRGIASTRAPWLFGPLFLAESPFRLRGELRSRVSRPVRGGAFSDGRSAILARAPLSPTRWRSAPP